MKKLGKYTKLYFSFFRQYVKSLMQSKVDFLLGLLGFLCSQFSGIAFLFLIFRQIPALKDWSFEQMIFIYGFSQIGRGLDHLFTDNLWMVSWQMVIKGTFDRYMLRPMNLLFQIICETVQFDAVGELAIGIYILIRAIRLGVVSITGAKIPALILAAIAGAVIYTSIKLLFASLAFWVKSSIAFLQAVYNTSDFAKYPMEIYPKIISTVMTFIIPFAFTAYIPATFFLDKRGFLPTIGIETLIAVVFFAISYTVFKIGASKYESAGS